MKRVLFSVLLVAAFACPALAQDKAQLRQSLQNMGRYDANKDGSISRDEVKQARMATFAQFDRNKDGFLSSDDIPTGMGVLGGNAALAQMQSIYDANKDGKISRAELVNGPTPAFNLADTNRDNKVTNAEREAAIAKLK